MKMKKGKTIPMILAIAMLVLIAVSMGRIVKAEDTLPKIVEGSEETIDGVTYVKLVCEGVPSGSTTSLRIAKDMLDTLDWGSFRNVKQEVLNVNQGYSLSDVKFEVTDKDSQEIYFYELEYTSEYSPLEERKIKKTTMHIKNEVGTIETWSNNNIIGFADKIDVAQEDNIEISEKMGVKKIVSYEQGTNYLDVIIEKDGSLVEGRLENFGMQTNKETLRFESKDNSFILKQYVGTEYPGRIIIEAGLKEDEITYLKMDDGEKINLQGLGIEEFGYNFIDKKIVGEINGKIGLITISDEGGGGKYTIKKGIYDLTTIEILGDGSIQKIQREEKTITSTSSDKKETISERIWIDGNLIYTEISGTASYIPEGFGIKEIESYNEDGSLNVVLDDNGNKIEGTLSKDGKTLSYESDEAKITLTRYEENKIKEIKIKNNQEIITIREDNNILSFKEGNTELNFHEIMGVESIDVDYEDSQQNWIATLSDGTRCKVEDNGNKLVRIEDNLVVAEVKDDGSAEIISKDKLGNDIKRTYDEEGNEISIKLNEEELDKKFFDLDDNLISELINIKLEVDLKDVEVSEDGELHYTGPPPSKVLPPGVSTTPAEVKSWKIIDSNTDEGTTTITYGDGKSVTMRTEMLRTIAPELNMIKDFDEIKVEGNILTYTTKGENLYDAIIEFNEDGKIKSKTYIKKNPDGTYTRTEIDENGETVVSGEVGAGVSAEGSVPIDIDEIWSNNMGIKLKNVYYDEGGVLYATLEDGSKGILLEDKNQFVYDDSVDGVIHTLQAIEGGSLLEYYKDESEDYGTIKISIDKKTGDEIEKETIIFEGIYDESNNVIMKGDELIAKIDEYGRILTDFNEEEIAQTIHYPASNEFFGTYAFGKVQNDQSEKIFLPGYEPIAFKTESGDLIIITTDDDGNRIYTDDKGNELNENSAGVKEAKAMVIKSKIGPAFYAAVEGARGGIALSNLLNSWLDIDFITNWRKKSDEFFSETVIGRIISGKWEESVCHSKIEKIPNSVAVVNINGEMGFAAHVEGERSAAITTSNETLYFYKITFGVNPYGMGNITFELLIDGNKADLDGDGTADKIKLEADETYSGTGENAVVKYKPEIYEEVCLKFYNTENLNAEFRNALKDNKLCNKIVEVDLSSAEISEPASSTAVSDTSTGQPGW